MSIDAVISEGRKFLFDDEIVPESLGRTWRKDLELTNLSNHGKNIARSSTGQWFCVFSSNKGVGSYSALNIYASGNTNDECIGSELSEPCYISCSDAFGYTYIHRENKGVIENSLILIDNDDNLNLFYSDEEGVHLCKRSVKEFLSAEELNKKEDWQCEEAVFPAGFYLGDAVLLKDGTIALYAVDTDGNLFEKCGDAESSKV
ncbi:MAG: hypothetical protein ACYTFY_12735, partial [Planctomycetota bacterium]